ncbi:Mitochondrial inner membrane protease atp23 [Entomophthora muscae]|uniref:Mitochondrial inner membrane protease atp23 n=1 Tax=Entomophthora muscae TaxID=34485 RepID=A0ACC2ULD0_9FUNG|nr:Mitochondrial inner membrane protease atp23 [Entomophthora muscae]
MNTNTSPSKENNTTNAPNESEKNRADSTEKDIFTKWSTYFSYKIGKLNNRRKNEKKGYEKCEKLKEELLLGRRLGVGLIRFILNVAPCDGTRSSGFNPDATLGNGPILLCQNGYSSKKQLEDTMAHELIHAYDHCSDSKLSIVDWDNLYHYACSVVRATSLSGNCGIINEFKRGHFSIAKQHQQCVRRRAILAVQAHPLCPDKETASKTVNAVFASCFADTSPFLEIY